MGQFYLSGDTPGCLPGGELYFFCRDCPEDGQDVTWRHDEPIDLTCPSCDDFPDPDPSFTVSRPSCDAQSVRAQANQVVAGISHQWNFVEVDANGEPAGDWSAPCWEPTCQLTLAGGRCYQIRHGIWSDCFEWTEQRQTLCIPEVVEFGDCCDDPELVRRIQCEPGEEFFENDCGCGCRTSSLQVEAEVEVEAACDRFGGMDAKVTVTAQGGTGPFKCTGPGEMSMPDERRCVFKGVAPGTYEYMVTDASGAVAKVAVEVEALFELATTITHPTSPGCNNGQASVKVEDTAPPFGKSPYTVRWNDPGEQPTMTATGLTPGTYKVLVTDDNGCFDFAEVTLFCEFSPPNEGDVRIHLRGAYVGIFGGGRFTELVDGGVSFVREVSFDDGVGIDLSLQRFISSQLSLEAAALFAELDVESVLLVEGAVPLTSQRTSEQLLALSAGANFHLFPRRRGDLYFGPFVSWLDLPDPPGLETDDGFALGGALGLDTPLGSSSWQLSAALRYVDTEIDLTSRQRGHDQTLDFDLLSFELGLSKSF